jgi:steroid delta-isomerase-like uncharacterized protein
MSIEQNKSIVRRWVEEGWNKGNLALIDQLFAPNFVQHEPPPETVTNREALRPYVSAYLSAFPDLRFSIDDLIAEGDKVVWRFTAKGTNNGPLMGMPPSGKNCIITGQIILRLENSRMVEAWLNLDALGMMQQLGVIQMAQAH